MAAGDIAAGELALLRAADPAQPRPLILAADGGGAHCLSAGVRPDLVVGDLDSLPSETRSRLEDAGVPFQRAQSAKDESDVELCLVEALARGARRITILGALGLERPEHSIANLLLLADPRLDDRVVTLVGHGARIRRIGSFEGPGRLTVEGQPRDFVSLFPVSPAVEGVVTEGLRFALHDETLLTGPSRGLSNELLGTTATVTTRRGQLFVVHTARSSEGSA